MSCGQVESTAIPDCYDPSVYNDTTTITADPDIAGVGVISAFIVATALALLLSFLHVLIDSDRVPQINKHVRNKEKWLGLLEALILTLSDQQLATGLAILIAGFVRWNEITIYHWEIITDLAFMSSNTHLSTLAVLRHTFRQHGQWGVRLWRIIAMLVFAILLFVANIYTGYGYWEDSPAWPMRCVALELKRDLRGNYRGSQARSAEVWSAFLISNYAVAILGLFENVSKWTRDLLQRKRDKVNRAYQKLEADREKGIPQASIPRMYKFSFSGTFAITNEVNPRIKPASAYVETTFAGMHVWSLPDILHTQQLVFHSGRFFLVSVQPHSFDPVATVLPVRP